MLHCNMATDCKHIRIEEGEIMESAPQRLAKPARRSLAAAQPARSKSAPAETAEVVSLPARAPSGATEPDLTAPSQGSARARLAYSLLKAAMDEAAVTFQSKGALFAGGWWGLQAHTVESVHAGALATIEFMEALNRAEGAKDVAAAHFAYSRRQRDAIERHIIEFLAAARNMISVLTAPPSDPPVDCSKPDDCPVGPCSAQSVAERLRTLTQQQRRVLELIAEGLPNKVIAYELGLCETTVKAHVSGILRKLCVYNRARVIALLANIDLASIGSPPLSDLPAAGPRR
jgi:DNA-binding CsgD family transcriptional regulator